MAQTQKGFMSKKQQDYLKYLQTPHWIHLRSHVMNSPYYGRPHECFICHATEKLRVHHMTYSRKGREQDDDLVILCESCHTQVHTQNGVFSMKGIYTKVFEMKRETLGIVLDRSREARKKRKSAVLQDHEKRIQTWKEKKKVTPPKPKKKNSLQYLGSVEYFRRKRLGVL